MSSHLKKYAAVLPVVLCMAGILAAPRVALASAKDGLDLFMTVVLPSLLPFFICSRLLLDTPLVEDAGHLLEPMMRPLFGCPGSVAFAMVVSFLSGYPAGARTIAGLYEEGRLGEDELHRAACLCSTSGPIFMLGAVGGGMFGHASAGWLILVSHYLAVIVSGVAIGGFSRRRTATAGRAPARSPAPSSSRPFGASLAEAVRSGVASITMVGGFIILFSMLTGLFSHFNITDAMGRLFNPLLRFANLPESLSVPIFSGILELTTGCRQAALAQGPAPILWAAACAIITWGGLSVQAQSMAFLSETPLSMGRFSAVKALQAVLAFTLCLLLGRLPIFSAGSIPCFSPAPTAVSTALSSLALLMTGIGVLLLLSVTDRLKRR